MLHHAFSVYDSGTGIYNLPFFAPHITVAVRQFKQLCNDPQSTIYKYPDAFALMHIGTYDDGRGFLENETPNIVATATACKEPDRQLTLINHPQEKTA